MLLKVSQSPTKEKKKAFMFLPLYILYTDNRQSSQTCINKKTMVNEEKQANIKRKTHTDIFGKAGIKVTRSINL